MKRLGFLIHDVLAHPLCGLLWIVGFQKAGDWFHEATVFEVNREDEVWPMHRD